MSEANISQAFTEYDEEGDKIIEVAAQSQEAKEYMKEEQRKQKERMMGRGGQKSVAFIYEPKTIEFKDFEVGKSHFLKLVLTNVSSGFNSFNVLPLPEKIRNYFEVSYTPKGRISPGITSDIKFKFFPQFNDDIHSHFSILSETGRIDIPIVCSSKKAKIKCLKPIVDFGKVIEGQDGTGKLIIRNQGSLATEIVLKSQEGVELQKIQGPLLELIQQLKFERVISIKGYEEKVILFKIFPTQIGAFRLNLQLHSKNFLHSPPISVLFTSTCIEVPVKIQKPIYDFQICLLNHIYREKLILTNSGELPMSFKVNQLKPSRKYFQFSPIIGYIQKQSKIDIWVKFTADKDLQIYLAQFLKNGFYIIPFEIQIKQQVLPVKFEIKFKITSDKVVVRPASLNFGSIFEGLSSKIEVNFVNESDLPQQVLLHPLKKNIFVDYDQTLFKILPKSSFKTYITYQSKTLGSQRSAKQEDSIPCKIITGDIAVNQIKIDYNCETIKPILSIVNNKIDLQALQVDEICYASTIFKNNSNRQIVFELFHPPFEICGLKITPVVKVLAANHEVEVNIEYHSFKKKLSPTTLRDLQKKSNPEEQKPVEQVPKDPKKEGKKQKLTKQQQEALEAEQKRLEEEERLRKQKQQKQREELERNFSMEKQLEKLGGTFIDFDGTQHYKWILPVYFKNKDYPDGSSEINFLEVTTTTIEKVLLVDQSFIDFGQIAVGSRKTRDLIVTNTGDSQELEKQQLPSFCCYSVLNSLKDLATGQSFRAVVEFQPTENQIFQHRLKFFTKKSRVSCLLKGKGVRPDINISPQNGLIDFGGVLLDEYNEKTFTIKNICNFQVEFMLKNMGQGIKNSNCSRPFVFIPTSGRIPPNDTVEIKARFQPDRIGEKYFTKVKVYVPQQKHERYIYVSGACYPRQAFVTDFKPSLMPSNEEVQGCAEYSFDWLRLKDQDTIYSLNKKTIVLPFSKTIENAEQQPESCFKRKLTIGSCKLLDPKMEKPTSFEFVLPKDDRFQCDNLKGTATPGTKVDVTFTYKPENPDPLIAKIPILLGIGQWKDIKGELKLSGGFIKAGVQDSVSFEVILRVYVNQI